MFVRLKYYFRFNPPRGYVVSWIMGRRGRRRGRSNPDYHRGPYMRIPRPDYGSLTDYSLREGRFASLQKRRYLVVFGLFFLVVGVILTFVLTPDDLGAWGFFSLLAADPRGIAFVAGIVGVLLALGYYYSAAGIDWPRETAGRILVIASVVGAALVALMLLVGHLEGRLPEVLPAARRFFVVLALAACLGLLLQRPPRSSR